MNLSSEVQMARGAFLSTYLIECKRLGKRYSPQDFDEAFERHMTTTGSQLPRPWTYPKASPAPTAAKKPAASKAPARPTTTTTATNPVAPTKETIDMKTAPKKTDAQMRTEALALAEKTARDAKDPQAREQAQHMVNLLDPKRGEVCAELDAKMGLGARGLAARSLAVQSGARHGMRAASRAEIQAEIARRGGVR